LRIGSGFDVHKLQADRKLVLGGVNIPHSQGLLGHSDADVLVHAICDALLGAAALGDIGRHFPDSNIEYKDVNSIKLLEEVGHKLEQAGYYIVNIDSTIVAQKPRLASYIIQMRQNIADALSLALEQVSIKATTTENLGFEGQEQGMSAQAVALIDNRP
jgi:2-C-methyl-D-erythritol 2,4-cyclodiphosphate synthase